MTLTTRTPERRQGQPRRYFKTTVICSMGPRGSEVTLFGQVVNLSSTGAQVLFRGDIRSGESLDLTFLNERRETIANLGAVVVWHHSEGPTAFRIGVRFDREMTYEEIASIA
ncbi:PilZ domain-containing protein [bacterium]|nr:PilZ domain-containing protein [bacterium]